MSVMIQATGDSERNKQGPVCYLGVVHGPGNFSQKPELSLKASFKAFL